MQRLIGNFIILHHNIYIFHTAQSVDTVSDSCILMFYLAEQLAADLVNKLHRGFGGVANPQDGLLVECFEDVGLNNFLTIVRSPDNQQHPLVIFDHTQYKNHQEGDSASEEGARSLIATLKNRKPGDHTTLLEKLRKIEGIVYMEEL